MVSRYEEFKKQEGQWSWLQRPKDLYLLYIFFTNNEQRVGGSRNFHNIALRIDRMLSGRFVSLELSKLLQVN